MLFNGYTWDIHVRRATGRHELTKWRTDRASLQSEREISYHVGGATEQSIHHVEVRASKLHGAPFAKFVFFLLNSSTVDTSDHTTALEPISITDHVKKYKDRRQILVRLHFVQSVRFMLLLKEYMLGGILRVGMA